MKTLSALMLSSVMLLGTAAFAADSKDTKPAATEAPKTSVKKHTKKSRKHTVKSTTAKPTTAATPSAAPAK